ncbi:hypothetical protein, partial [Thiolapillus sp.]|uniref:hypothetical protein n=1 Tax=Thiolapillus sp. TaxID=2017437 RepID=UPI003AF56D09
RFAATKEMNHIKNPANAYTIICYPRNFMDSRDDRAGYCFHKGFSEGVPYPGLRATEENFLWEQ